jgi:hypothetical protein
MIKSGESGGVVCKKLSYNIGDGRITAEMLTYKNLLF